MQTNGSIQPAADRDNNAHVMQCVSHLALSTIDSMRSRHFSAGDVWQSRTCAALYSQADPSRRRITVCINIDEFKNNICICCRLTGTGVVTGKASTSNACKI
jgi:hypothetical protein